MFYDYLGVTLTADRVKLTLVVISATETRKFCQHLMDEAAKLAARLIRRHA